MKYVALLRSVNVGGNNMIKMSELQACLTAAGFKNAKTYIQSGNVLFESNETDTQKLAKKVVAVIEKTFKISVDAVVLSHTQLKGIIKNKPAWWGEDDEWKHNLIFLLEPYNAIETLKEVGELQEGIEAAQAGDGVIYQSISWKDFGRSTSGKISSKPVYKRMTIRNFNTANKLLALMD